MKNKITNLFSVIAVIFCGLLFSSSICDAVTLTKTPVLIVPGLLGTGMEKGSNALWINPEMVNPFNDDSFMDPLQFSSSLIPSDNQVATTGVIKSVTANIGGVNFDLYNYTGGLINEFENQGYSENPNLYKIGNSQTLFTFPYDWRYGVSGKFADGTTNEDLLAQEIQSILQQTGSSKVDIVAHSLGGLIVKKYVMDHPSDNHIGKAVFVGVPNTGSPKAAKILLQGDNLGILGLSDAEIKKISQNIPAVYDLLPDQQYYDTKGSYVETIDQTQCMNDFTTPCAIKDLNHQESDGFLSAKGTNSLAISNSDSLHAQNFDNFDLRTAGVDLYAIDGCKSATLSKIIYTTYNDFLGTEFSYDARFTPGDNTVPLESATNLPINSGNKYYALVSDHGKMPSQEGIRQEIVNLISGSNLSTGVDGWGRNLITQDIANCDLNGKAISVFSPVNIFVTDQNGNRLGLADDGSVINEIPNADFEMWGDRKFVYLPQDSGEVYNINLEGQDAGTFTIKSQDISDNQITQTEVFSNLPVTPSLTGQMNISPTDNTTTLSLDNSPAPVLPSATLDAAASADLLPPVSVATLSGTVGQPGFYRSNVSVNIKAKDDLSGVLALNYNLDGSGFQKISKDKATFLVSTEGAHTITFFSTDNAGNNEPKQTINFVIDKTAPEAVIQFDPSIKDLKFTGADNLLVSSSVLVKDNDDTITLTDQAGNNTEIKLKDKNRKITMSAEIKSLKYNGAPADLSKNQMAYLWLYDKNKNLKILSQYVTSKKNYNILAVYDGKNTNVTGKDFPGKISKSFSGLEIIKITTSKGDLSWGY